MPPSRWISLTLAFALILPACDSQGSARPRGELATALDALCEARMLSARGRIGEAEATFTDRAHAFLHRLARQTDRASAAELLEAKARVEQAFLEPPPPAALARLLETLRRRTAEAGEAEVPPCR